MNNLKQIRLDAGMSQSELANKAEINVRTIQHYEQGFRDINKTSALTLYKLAQALGTQMEKLLQL